MTRPKPPVVVNVGDRVRDTRQASNLRRGGYGVVVSTFSGRARIRWDDSGRIAERLTSTLELVEPLEPTR